MSHLENMEALAESVRLRAYGQHDPLVEYRREGHLLFQQLLHDFDQWVGENKEKLNVPSAKENSTDHMKNTAVNNTFNMAHSTLNIEKVGRNDPCPCGAKDENGHSIKYKRCHGP